MNQGSEAWPVKIAVISVLLAPVKGGVPRSLTGSRPPSSSRTTATAQYNGEDMRAMATQLAAHGFTTHLADFRAGLDLTATLSPSGKREAELILDEDGYAELRYWVPAGTSPADAVATALRALNAITGTVPNPGPSAT
jgi:hypothetical protein